MQPVQYNLDTIVALCTPRGSGALALIRLSGEQAVHIATHMSLLASGKQLVDLPTHTIHYGSVVDENKQVIDQVMFLLMHGPKTFTGEDTVEITCHNNPFIIEAIIEQSIKHGARLAQEGEFTRRAVLNNKMDIIQAEALKELIHANTQMALKKSLSQLNGTMSHWTNKLEQLLIKTLALSEASFEFIDEEMTFNQEIHANITTAINEIASIKKTFNNQQQIRQGIRVAIIGTVNAGKSSLFNALINYNRAIVTSIPGTTRDSLEAGTYQYGTYITFIDTAGLRQTDDIIEQEGIIRAHQEAQKADIILLVFDGSRSFTQEEYIEYQSLMNTYTHKIILVRNKSDVAHINDINMPGTICLSSITRENFAHLEHALEHKIQALFEHLESPFLLNQRQHTLLMTLEKKLLAIQFMFNDSVEYELLSYELKEAIAHLAELTGKTVSEQGMDAIFREFCVGK